MNKKLQAGMADIEENFSYAFSHSFLYSICLNKLYKQVLIQTIRYKNNKFIILIKQELNIIINMKGREKYLITRNSTRPGTSYTTINTSANTSINNSQPNSPPKHFITSCNTLSVSPESITKARRCQSAQTRVKLLKSHLQALKSSYNHLQKKKVSLTTSLNKTNKQISSFRREFINLYATKKHRIQSSEMLNQKQAEEKQRKDSVRNKTKQKKLLLEVQAMVTRQERENRQAEIRQRNKKQKQQYQARLHQMGMSDFYERKQKFIAGYQEKERIKQKKLLRDNFVRTKGRQRYWDKAKKEMMVIENYQNLMNNIEKIVQNQDSFEETLFVTRLGESQRMNEEKC